MIIISLLKKTFCRLHCLIFFCLFVYFGPSWKNGDKFTIVGNGKIILSFYGLRPILVLEYTLISTPIVII